MRVTVDTGPYERENCDFIGKKPRGRGSWAFQIGEGDPWLSHSTTYTEAKKAAIAEARSRGVGVIRVLP